ncbi:MAG: hypothetical protein F4X75_12085 [Gemmatimonadetes bacterium]|nr:hypothetical protein [Gemmatimonadota bacterium]
MVLPKNTAINPAVFPLSLAAGVLLALCIGVGVRLNKERLPNQHSHHYNHLFDKPAPSFEIEGLSGGRVSSQKGSETWLLYFTDSGSKACDAAYPTLKKIAQYIPVTVIGLGNRTQLSDKLAQHGIVATVGYDSLRSVPPLYQADVFPSAMLIDPEGIVRQAAIGSNGIERIVIDVVQKEKGGR